MCMRGGRCLSAALAPTTVLEAFGRCRLPAPSDLAPSNTPLTTSYIVIYIELHQHHTHIMSSAWIAHLEALGARVRVGVNHNS